MTLCIHSKAFVLNGQWAWNMQSNAVFGSDVMDFPADYEGTKGIIHPDDLPNVSRAMELLPDGKLAAFDFRLITTYGEVVAISGKNVSLDKSLEQAAGTDEKASWEKALQDFALRRETEYLRQRKALADTAEKLYTIGSFAINKRTGEAWYSDGIYAIHGLAPQSLNAHANTFHPFLHPEDRLPFLDAFEAAYAGEFPLHLEYRIQLSHGEPRTVRLVTGWLHNSLGQPICTGILRDLSEDREMAAQVAESQSKTLLHQQVLKFSEQYWNTGYWFIDLVTRKVSYSNNYYRLHGLKQQSLPTSSSFLNLVHPDDRSRVRTAMNTMYNEHSLPEIEFRIIRPDGKQRQLRQTGKLFSTSANLLMVGVVQDITVQRGLEKKIAELNERASLHKTIQQITEGLADTAFVTWYNEGQMTWSEGFFRLLGYKPGEVEPSSRILHRQIHPDDLKAFKDVETLVLNGQKKTGLRFRIVNRTGERHLAISFNHIGSDDREVVFGVVKDLTRELAIEQKLAETTQYARTLNAVISDAILLTDTENIVLDWNEAAEEKTGIKAADALCSNLFDLFPLLLDAVYMGHLQTARNGVEVRELKARNAYLRKAHHYRLIPIKNENGQVTKLLHVVQDISKELELQQQLAERLNFIENLVEASVDRIVVLDKHMNYIYWNKKAEEYYAIPKERVIGRNILEVFPGFRNDPGYNSLRRVLKSETVYLPPLLGEESTEYFETYLIPVKDEREEVTSILWIVHDLRNELQLQIIQHKAKQQLEEEHRRLKEAQAIGRVGSFQWRVGENLTHWSDELYRINGLEPQSEEITLDKADQFIHPGDFDGLQHLKQESLSTPGEYNMVHRIRLRNGEVRWVNHQWESIAGESGTVERVTGIVQDVTEKKTAEETLSQRQQLQQATMDASMDMIQVLEAVRNEEGEIIDFRYLLSNHEAEKWMPGAIGKSLLQLQPGVMEEGIFDTFKQVVESGIPSQNEIHYVHKQFNGWFQQSVVKLNDGVATTTSDITARKKAEQEILRLKDERIQGTEDKYRKLFDTMEEGFASCEVVRNTEGAVVDWRYLEVNSAVERHAGLPPDQVTGRLVSDLLPGLSQEWFQMVGRVVDTQQPEHLEQYNNVLDRWHEMTLFHFGPERFAILYFDVTARKKREEQQAYLLKLNDTLRSTFGAEEIEEKITAVAMEYFGADRCYYCTIEGDHSIIRRDAKKEDLPSVAGSYPLSSFPLLKKVIDEGLPFVVHDAHTTDILDAPVREVCLLLQDISFVDVPVIKNGKAAGVLCLVQSTPRNWTQSEINLSLETAERIWAAVERAKAEEDLRKNEERMRCLKEAFQSVVNGASLAHSLHILTRLVVEETGGEGRTAFYMANAEGTQLHTIRGAGNMPEAYADEIDGFLIGGDTLTCGLAMPAGQAVITPDVYEEPRWRPWTLMADKYNYRSCWSFPIRTKEARVVGTLAMYFQMAREASAKDRELADVVTQGAAVIIASQAEVQERLRAEAALRQSEEQLRQFSNLLEQQVSERTKALQESAVFVGEITQIIPDRITIHDARTMDILYTNYPDFWKDLYGNSAAYQKTEEKRAIGLVHPEEKQKLQAFLQQRNALSDDEVGEIELRMAGDKWMRIRSKVFKRDEKGEAAQIISFTTDITEKKNAALEHQKNTAILQHTEELAQIGSWEYDIATGEFTWSEGMYKLFGLPQQMKVRPEIYLDYSLEEDRSIAKRIVNNLKKKHQAFEETMHIKKDKSQRLLRIKASVVKDENGKPKKVVGVDLDLTDIRQAETRAKEMQHWLEQTALISPDAICVYDLQHNQPVYLNDSLAQWVGLTSEELVKMGIDGRLQLVHPDDRLRLLQFNELLRGAGDGQVRTLDYRLLKKDNTLLWVRNRSKVFLRNEKGDVTHMLSILQDVTEEQAAAQVLKDLNTSLEIKNAELESKNEEITSFAFVASHDLKEPLRKIHTFSDWLLTKEPSLTETGKQNLERLTLSVKRLDLLIDDILALTKVHVRNEKQKPVDMNRLLQQLQDEMQEKIHRSGAILKVGPLPTLTGAGNQLFYLFKNLISNAIKFQPQGQVPRISISMENETGFIKVLVTDNGIGIAPAYHKKIFEVFRRLHARTEYEGTGMGLSICKKIMEKHGGKITVQSETDKGATFVCWFPAALST